MWKKLAFGAAALAFLLLANLNLYCRVSINGQELEGLFSPEAVDRCEAIASRAAEEILSGPALMPEAQRRYQLSLFQPDGDELRLSDCILRSVTGVKSVNGVYINGILLGTVADGEELLTRLQGYISGQMPNVAATGSIDGDLQLRQIYSRSNRETNYDDMILLISGMAPVMYFDETGRYV